MPEELRFRVVGDGLREARADLAALRGEFTQLNGAAATVGSGTAKASAGLDQMGGSADKAAASSGRAGVEVTKAGSSADVAGAKFGKASTLFAGFAGGIAGFAIPTAMAQLPQLFDAVFNGAVKLEQQGKKAATVFGDELGTVREWAEESASAMGLTATAATSLATDVGDLLVPLGATRAEAADMSTEMVGLAGVMSEWTSGQKSAEQATEAMRKALLGEREMLKEFGVAISEADVQTRVLANGQAELTGNALQLAKAQATLELIFEKTGDAQASYAAGGDSAIRKQAEFKAATGELTESLQTGLYPAIVAITDVMVEAAPAMEAVGQTLQLVGEGLGLFIDVGKAAVDVWDSLPEPVQQVLKALIPIVGQFDNIRDAMGRLRDAGGDFQAAFVAPVLDGFATMVDAASHFASAWDSTIGEVAGFVGIDVKIGDNIRGLADDIRGMADEMRGAGEEGRRSADGIIETGEAASTAAVGVRELAAGWSVLASAQSPGGMQAEIDGLIGKLFELQEAGQSLLDVKFADYWVEGLYAVEEAAAKAALSQAELTLSAMQAAGATDAQIASQKDLIKSLKDQISGYNDSRQAMTDWGAAMEALNTDLLGGKDHVDRMKDSIGGLVQAAGGANEAIALSNDLIFFMGDKADETASNLLDLAQDVGATKVEVNEFGQAVVTLPDGKTVTVDLDDLATKPLGNVEYKVTHLPDGTVTVTANTSPFDDAIAGLLGRPLQVGVQVVADMASILFKAEGGAVGPGNAYIVGEKGPELFVTEKAGTIIPADRTAAILKNTGAAAGNTELPDFSQLLDVLDRINEFGAKALENLSYWAGWFSETGIDHAQTYASAVASTFGTIAAGYEAAELLTTDMAPVSEEAIQNFAEVSAKFMDSFVYWSGWFETEGMEHAGQFANTLSSIGSGITDSLDAMDALSQDWHSPTQATIDRLSSDLGALTQGFALAAATFEGPVLDHTAHWAATVGVIADTVGSGVDAMDALEGYSAAAMTVVEQFAFDMAAMADVFVEAAAGSAITVDMANATAIWASTVNDVTSTVGSGVDAMASLKDYSAASLLVVEQFAFDMAQMVDIFVLASASSGLTTQLAEGAAIWAGTVGASVSIIGDAVEGVELLTDYSGEGLANAHVFVSDMAVIVNLVSAHQLTEELAEGASHWLHVAGGAVSIIGEAIDGLAGLSKYKGASLSRVGDFWTDVHTVVTAMVDKADLSVRELRKLERFSRGVGAAIGSIKSGLDVLKNLGEYVSIGGFDAGVSSFFADLEQVVIKVGNAADDIPNRLEKAAARLGERLGKVFGGINEAISGVSAIATVQNPTLDQIDDFIDASILTIEQLADRADEVPRKTAKAAARISEAFGEAFSGITNAVSGLTAIAGAEEWPTQEELFAFIDQMVDSLQHMADYAETRLTAGAAETGASVASGISAVMGAIGQAASGLQSLEELAEGGFELPIDAFITKVLEVVGKIAALGPQLAASGGMGAEAAAEALLDIVRPLAEAYNLLIGGSPAGPIPTTGGGAVEQTKGPSGNDLLAQGLFRSGDARGAGTPYLALILDTLQSGISVGGGGGDSGLVSGKSGGAVAPMGGVGVDTGAAISGSDWADMLETILANIPEEASGRVARILGVLAGSPELQRVLNALGEEPVSSPFTMGGFDLFGQMGVDKWNDYLHKQVSDMFPVQMDEPLTGEALQQAIIEANRENWEAQLADFAGAVQQGWPEEITVNVQVDSRTIATATIDRQTYEGRVKGYIPRST